MIKNPLFYSWKINIIKPSANPPGSCFAAGGLGLGETHNNQKGMFTPEEIQEIKKLYLKEFGETISDEQIVECARVLLDLLTTIYKEDDFKEGLNEKI